MNKTLLILRHAHSNDKQQGQTDKQRELSREGVRGAIKIGSWIKEQSFGIETIISSTANRTMGTATIIANAIGYNPADIVQKDEIYNASTRSLISIINELDEDLTSVIIVGHNPDLSYFAEYLSSSELSSMPTGGLAVIQFANIKWSQVTKSTGSLLNFISPELLD